MEEQKQMKSLAVGYIVKNEAEMKEAVKRIYEMPLSSRESGPLKTGSLWETCLAAWFIIRHTVSR